MKIQGRQLVFWIKEINLEDCILFFYIVLSSYLELYIFGTTICVYMYIYIYNIVYSYALVEYDKGRK